MNYVCKLLQFNFYLLSLAQAKTSMVKVPSFMSLVGISDAVLLNIYKSQKFFTHLK